MLAGKAVDHPVDRDGVEEERLLEGVPALPAPVGSALLEIEHTVMEVAGRAVEDPLLLLVEDLEHLLHRQLPLGDEDLSQPELEVQLGEALLLHDRLLEVLVS